MYEERQKKWVFDQTTGTSHESQPPQKNHSNTATSNYKAGGMTSLSPAKPAGNAIPWEPGTGRWQSVKMTTYSEAGEPMDIGKLRMEGRCFWCHEKGHLSKDCPKKQEYKDTRSVQTVPEQEKTESKVEEVKDTPVLESTNRYAALSIESTNDNDNDLCPWDDRHDTGDAAAATGEQSRWDPYGIEGRMPLSQDLKSKPPSPLLLGPVQENLKGPSQSPARAQAKAAEPAGHGVENPQDKSHDQHTRATPGPKMGIKNGPLTLKGTGKTGNTTFTVQVEPDMLPGSGPLTRSATHSSISILEKRDEDDEEAVAMKMTTWCSSNGWLVRRR
ncbi:hypothetical protein ARMSODRAFT_1020807 [Armillaria solidipes]|uniref:CCHC-type domain-containing protein n=1 Tax=Armillaria solidipes TaxID=1076256 RepID=A0A2H3B8W9_9AGAR|nr:hypothetical protein ARMSODRAFT_1020807 [Armillaria solidipes]